MEEKKKSKVTSIGFSLEKNFPFMFGILNLFT